MESVNQIHSDTQELHTVPIGKYTFKHKTVQYIKIFHGTEGYKAESVPGEEKNQTLPALEEKKGGGGVEAQQDSYCPPYYFRHLLSKLTWVVLIC